MAHLDGTHKPATRRQAIVTADSISEKLADEKDEAAKEATLDLADLIAELLEADDD